MVLVVVPAGCARFRTPDIYPTLPNSAGSLGWTLLTLVNTIPIYGRALVAFTDDTAAHT